MTRPTSFEDVLRSSAAEVEVLLREGDAQERVWSAWVLGLREPSRHDSVLATALAEENDPGVRRHLLVVLASSGHRELVARAAARDHDPDARATAVRLLARLAEPGDTAAFDLLCTRAIDIAWQVRHAVADALPIPTPALPHHRTIVERLVGMLFDPDADVRAAVRARAERGELPADATREILETLDRVHDSRTHGPPEQISRALVRYRPPLHLA